MPTLPDHTIHLYKLKINIYCPASARYINISTVRNLFMKWASPKGALLPSLGNTEGYAKNEARSLSCWVFTQQQRAFSYSLGTGWARHISVYFSLHRSTNSKQHTCLSCYPKAQSPLFSSEKDHSEMQNLCFDTSLCHSF